MSKQVEPELKECPWCRTKQREIHKTEGGFVGIIIHDLGCYLARHEDDRRQVLTPHGVTAWNTRVPVASTAPGMDERKQLGDVLGFLHVINTEANLLVNFTNDPNLRPKERGEKIQEYRLKAHRAICALMDMPAASPAPREEESEIRFALEGMIAAFDRDDYGDASVVATTRECALSVAKRAVGWDAEMPTTPPAPTVSDCDPDG